MSDSLKFITSQRSSGYRNQDELEFSEDLRPRKGVFARLKEALVEMMFEETKPIGISQLTRCTFQGNENDPGIFFKNRQPQQDYRFSKLVEAKFNDSHGRY